MITRLLTVLFLSVGPWFSLAGAAPSASPKEVTTESIQIVSPTTSSIPTVEQSAVVSGRRRTAVSGWTQVSYTASGARQSNRPIAFNDHPNELLLQQNWLRIDCPTQKDRDRPDVGFRSDWILPGSDYRYVQARGLFNDQECDTGVDPISFHLDLFFPKIGQGTQILIGRFPSIQGTETIDAPGNRLCTHSYIASYGASYTHTGILANTTLSKETAIQLGLATGSDIFLCPGTRATFMGSLRIGPEDLKNTGLISLLLGPGQYDLEHEKTNINVVDALYARQISRRLSLNFEAIYGYQDDVPDLKDTHWSGFAAYANYQLSEKLSCCTRIEAFDDQSGYMSGSIGVHQEVTTGLCYRPGKRLQTRIEVRYDRCPESAPYEGRSELLTATTDVLFFW